MYVETIILVLISFVDITITYRVIGLFHRIVTSITRSAEWSASGKNTHLVCQQIDHERTQNNTWVNPVLQQDMLTFQGVRYFACIPKDKELFLRTY